jgi:hypothetical protein
MGLTFRGYYGMTSLGSTGSKDYAGLFAGLYGSMGEIVGQKTFALVTVSASDYNFSGHWYHHTMYPFSSV